MNYIADLAPGELAKNNSVIIRVKVNRKLSMLSRWYGRALQSFLPEG
ncbi:MAG: hypothetical protein QW325_03400 [Nitrososphaerota archaeon]